MLIVTPAPSGSRGEIILQPNYFTSSTFIKAIRDDLTTLIHLFHDQYTKTRLPEPFSLFKTLWTSKGWKWVHLMAYNDRAREAFLASVLRIFLERMVKTEAPYSRVVALFGLYTFFYTQPKGASPTLYTINHIPIPSDHFASLKALPSSLSANHLQPLQAYVAFILSTLLQGQAFFITPRAELGSLNPRDIPRALFADEASILSLDINPAKKKGRPTKRDMVRKARRARDNLDKWLYDTLSPPDIPHSPELSVAQTLQHYQAEKAVILDSIYARSNAAALSLHAGMTVEKSNQTILERLKAAQGLFSLEDMCLDDSTESIGITRVERAAQEFGDAKAAGWKGGALNLLEGAGQLKSSMTRPRALVNNTV